MAINRNLLALLFVLAVGVIGVLSYQLYQEKREPKGVAIELGTRGITIEKK